MFIRYCFEDKYLFSKSKRHHGWSHIVSAVFGIDFLAAILIAIELTRIFTNLSGLLKSDSAKLRIDRVETASDVACMRLKLRSSIWAATDDGTLSGAVCWLWLSVV